MSSTDVEALTPSASGHRGDPLMVGGLLSALGAAGVVVTSAFYAVSPPAAAGPVQPLVLAAAIAGALRGAATLHAAGVVGIFGDLVWATAALLIALEFGRRGRGVSAAGWIALFLSILIFTLVDGMTGFVFPPLAAANSTAAFEGFKRLWDMLFLLGAAAFGVGVASALAADATSPRPMVSRLIGCALIAVGVVAGLDALAGFAGFSGVATDKVAGASIALGAALFVPASLQIARASQAT